MILRVLEVFLAGLLVVIMFNLLRQLENWLHQHIFKVGWLLTKNFQTTTILYYTFFLPGVFLHEFVYWLAAGALDVHADRSIAWPEKQEIGELRLNFVKLSSKASSVKVAVISTVPLLAGLVFISFVANNVFDISSVLDVMHDGRLPSISAGLKQLMATPDFWLWAYILFTVSNTMMPDPNALRGGRWVAIAIAVVTVPLFIIGVGDEVVGSAVTGPIADVLNILSSIFAIVIATNLVGVAILGSIEALIERITGDSATFRNGKMVVMRREELIAQRQQEREKQRSGKKPRRKATAKQGLPSVYQLVLPIPGPPGREPVTRTPEGIVDSSDSPALPKTSEGRPRRIEPDVVDGTAADREIRFGPAASDDQDVATRGKDPTTAPALRPPESGGRFGGRAKPDTERGGETAVHEESEPARPESRFARRSEMPLSSVDEKEGQDDAELIPATPTSSRQRPQRVPSPFGKTAATGDESADEDRDDNAPARVSRFGQRSPRSTSPFSRPSADADESSDSDKAAPKSTRLQPPQRSASPFRRPSAGVEESSDVDNEELTYEDVEDSP